MTCVKYCDDNLVTRTYVEKSGRQVCLIIVMESYRIKRRATCPK